MRRVLVPLLGVILLALASGPLSAQSMCLQDQYGNQHNFEFDFVHNYVYGTTTMAQGCDEPNWVLIGSWVKQPGGAVVELTAANPLGDADIGCISEFKLKGNYPNFAWYYAFGYGSQESTYVDCGVSPTADPGEGGALRPADQ